MYRMWYLLDINFDFVHKKVTLWRVGPVNKHGVLTDRPGIQHEPHVQPPTHVNLVQKPKTTSWDHDPVTPLPRNLMWQKRGLGNHASVTTPHAHDPTHTCYDPTHTQYDDTQVAQCHSPGCCPRLPRLPQQVSPDVPLYDSQAMLQVDTRPLPHPTILFFSPEIQRYTKWGSDGIPVPDPIFFSITRPVPSRILKMTG